VVNSTNFPDTSHAIASNAAVFAHDGFLADARRVAADIYQRRYSGDSTLTWQLLREVEDETLFDVNLMCRWPDEVAACMHSARPSDLTDALTIGESIRDEGYLVASSFALALADTAN
jgi:hypothetical protein